MIKPYSCMHIRAGSGHFKKGGARRCFLEKRCQDIICPFCVNLQFTHENASFFNEKGDANPYCLLLDPSLHNLPLKNKQNEVFVLLSYLNPLLSTKCK